MEICGEPEYVIKEYRDQLPTSSKTLLFCWRFWCHCAKYWGWEIEYQPFLGIQELTDIILQCTVLRIC